MTTMLAIIIFAGHVIGFFIVLLFLAFSIQMILPDIAKDHPSIDPYATTIILWTLLLTSEMGNVMCNYLALLLGGLPVAIGHCRATKHLHPRHSEFYLLKEIWRVINAPFLAFKYRFVGLVRRLKLGV